MWFLNAIRRVLTFLASMGLTVKDDRPRVIDMTGREWGDAVDGLALSIREAAKEDPKQLPVLSVVLKNNGPGRKSLIVPGWLFFYEINVTGPAGATAPPTAYGRELLKPEHRTEKIDVALAPGDATEADLPVGLLYEMRTPGNYRVRVSCHLSEQRAPHSNEIVVSR